MSNQSGLAAPVRTYLAELTERCRDQLGDRLVGLYLHGSAAQSDFRDKSDLDVLGVVEGPWPVEAKRALARSLEHGSLPVPAAGLDVIVVTAGTARSPAPDPPYEFWFSTGETWPTELEVRRNTTEVALTLAICRSTGVALHGPTPSEVIAEVPRDWVLSALVDVLEWHATKILHAFHDPLGQNSVLNACRAWRYAEEQTFGSKSDGARWVLERESAHVLAAAALAIRRGERNEPLDGHAVRGLLSNVVELCRGSIAEG